MKTSRLVLNLGAFTLAFAVMVFWAINNIVSVDQLERPYPISAEFTNAFGILPNAEVTYLGVAYGQVRSVERIRGGVVVNMEIQRGNRIPEGSTANIYRKSAIGEPYVDFAPPDRPAGDDRSYRAGTRLPMSRTTVPLEFSELLRSAGRLIESVPPEAVGGLLQELSTGLEGRTDSLRALTESGDELAASLAERTEVLDRLATNNTRLTSVFTDHRHSLGQSLADLRQVADSLARARGDVNVLLDRGSQLLGQVADVVANQKGNLDCDLKVLELVLDRTTQQQQLDYLRALLVHGPTAFNNAWGARDVETTGPFPGVWARVGFIANLTHNPAVQYVPFRTLPPPAAVGPCASSLQATGSYRPAAAPGGPGLAATGGSIGLVAGLALASAALVLRQVRRSEVTG
jgi:phospholipid/cholesterol/gamma-HCH transport system substrate-binding protein